jgi:hypothetical protein
MHPKERKMYQWSVAHEMAELSNLERSQFGDAERLRAEAIEEWEEQHPSLLAKVISIFRPQPEALIARSAVEAELIGAINAGRGRDAA